MTDNDFDSSFTRAELELSYMNVEITDPYNKLLRLLVVTTYKYLIQILRASIINHVSLTYSYDNSAKSEVKERGKTKTWNSSMDPSTVSRHALGH